MLEVLQQDYIRTARAKGIGQTGILVRSELFCSDSGRIRRKLIIF
jgi:hypothetical protein